MEQSTYQKFIKKKTLIILSFLLILTILVSMLIVLINYNNKKHYNIIDVYAKQRMLTQMMTKDALVKYQILKETENIELIEIQNQKLINTRDEFASTLASLELELNNKTLFLRIKSQFEIASLEWDSFKESLNNIISINQIDEDFLNALEYIVNHNDGLQDYCNGITQSLITLQNYQTKNFIIITVVGFISSLIVSVIMILQLQKYIINPLDELYKNIANLGFLNKKNNISLPTKEEIKPVFDEINIGFNKLHNLLSLMQKINEETSFEGTLGYIYNSFSQFIPYTHIGIALLTDNGETLTASYGISDSVIKDKISEMIGLKAKLKDTSLGRIIKEGSLRVVNDLDIFNKGKISHYNQILTKAGIKSSITLPLKVNNKPVGVIFFSSIYKNIYNENHIMFLEALSNSIAISLNQNIFIDELIFSTILALAKMAESRDEDTGDHLDRMKQYAVKIAEFLFEDEVYPEQINYDFIKKIEKFSQMHDIGKVGVRDGILLKPGKLTFDEFEEMKKHTIYGAEVLRTAENNILKSNKSIFKFGIEIAESHHEKWDGTGYPYNKKGEEIPLSARIVAVADVFDALTSKRPYKEPFSFAESFSIIIEGKGKHFDPIIIDSLIKHKSELYNLYNSFNV